MSKHPRSARRRILSSVTLLAALSIGATSLQASTCVWTGAVSGVWSAAGNWSGCAAGAPVNGDSLVFPQAGANKNTTHELAPLTEVAGISFSGTTSGYSLSGNGLGIGTGGISNDNTSGVNQIDMDLTLIQQQSFAGNAGAMLLSSGLDLNGQPLAIAWSNTSGLVPWTIASAITGHGSINVAGANGATGLRLQGDNTFTGTVAIQSGRILLDHSHALGAGDGQASNGTTVSPTASLVLATHLSIGNEALVLQPGAGQNGNGQLQFSGISAWGGPVQLAGSGQSRVISVFAGSQLTFNGVVSGTGGFVLGASPEVIVRFSNSGNSFTGRLATANAAASQGVALRLGADGAIPPASAVELRGNSSFDLAGFDTSLGSLSCTGTDSVHIGFGSSLTVGSNGNSTDCAASISGNFSNAPFTALTKIGSGVLTLSGESTFEGEVDVLGGGLEVNGALIPVVQTAIFVSSGQNATLFGDGVVGNVVASGHVHGGSSDAPGTLTASFLSFPALGKISARLADLSSYDQLSVGNVSLGSIAQLSVIPGFAAPPGSVFVLINNIGTQPISGQFAGLPEGAAVVANESVFTISYIGGDGNDLTLTAVSPLLFASGFE
jgi:fibronectin-binding autotransporter adhesin